MRLPLDFDVDGVPDDLDQCRDTRGGIHADSTGCPPIHSERCRETVCLGPEHALVRGENFARLDSLAVPLVETGARVDIFGDTDQEGSADCNLMLCDCRLQAIMDYLVTGGSEPRTYPPVRQRQVSAGDGHSAAVKS